MRDPLAGPSSWARGASWGSPSSPDTPEFGGPDPRLSVESLVAPTAMAGNSGEFFDPGQSTAPEPTSGGLGIGPEQLASLQASLAKHGGRQRG
jgi:hypothetical protein